MMTQSSQQMVANFLLHVVSFLRYVSRQQGDTNCRRELRGFVGYLTELQR